MTLRVKYIFESKKDVFTVPVNAIYEKNGKSFILAHIGEKVNKYTLEEFPVIVKEKNDYEAVITSDTKLQGLNVINMPDKYSAGMEVGPIEESDEAKNE